MFYLLIVLYLQLQPQVNPKEELNKSLAASIYDCKPIQWKPLFLTSFDPDIKLPSVRSFYLYIKKKKKMCPENYISSQSEANMLKAYNTLMKLMS